MAECRRSQRAKRKVVACPMAAGREPEARESSGTGRCWSPLGGPILLEALRNGGKGRRQRSTRDHQGGRYPPSRVLSLNRTEPGVCQGRCHRHQDCHNDGCGGWKRGSEGAGGTHSFDGQERAAPWRQPSSRRLTGSQGVSAAGPYKANRRPDLARWGFGVGGAGYEEPV
jgi:hypothetical protein